MGFVSLARDGRFSSVVLATSIAVCATGAAMASDAPPVDPSIQRFEHVRVINAPIATPAAATETMVDMRAYKDADTGAFRAPTAEEAAALAPASAAAAPALRRSSAAAAPAFHSTRSGGTAILLDESSMQYSVVSRQPDGSLVEICVPGEKAAAEAVGNPAAFLAAARQQGVRNDR